MGIRIDWIGYLIVLLALLEVSTAATTYKVGDDSGWRIPTNTSFYEDWVANKTFVAGDSLVFNWTGAIPHNVFEVTTKAEYDNCTNTNGIRHDTSPVNVNLIANGTRYFICTIGNHCSLGQKVTIKVGNGISSSSPSFAHPLLPITITAYLSPLLFSYIIIIFLGFPV